MVNLNLGNLMNQLKNVQKQLEKVQEELETVVVEGSAGGGMVKVKANGKEEILSVKIDPEILREDIEMIEEMVVAAVNQAVKKAQEAYQEKIAEVTGGIFPQMPGGFKIPGL